MDHSPRLRPIHEYMDEEEDPRRDKPWPPEEDCPGCPEHRDGPHKMSCVVTRSGWTLPGGKSP